MTPIVCVLVAALVAAEPSVRVQFVAVGETEFTIHVKDVNGDALGGASSNCLTARTTPLRRAPRHRTEHSRFGA